MRGTGEQVEPVRWAVTSALPLSDNPIAHAPKLATRRLGHAVECSRSLPNNGGKRIQMLVLDLRAQIATLLA